MLAADKAYAAAVVQSAAYKAIPKEEGLDSYDYVIVGAGSAGSVLANRLSEDGSTTVLVLEAGPRDWHPWIHIPAGFMKTFHNPRVNWLYQMEPGAWTGGRSILAPRGKTLGGSSSINGHVYNRGQRMDFDTWAQLGNRGWGYADVLPYFRRMERRLGDGDPTFRGRDGSLTVSDLDWRHPRSVTVRLPSRPLNVGSPSPMRRSMRRKYGSTSA